MRQSLLLALFAVFAVIFEACAADRTISQTVDITTARVNPSAIGFFRGESVAYSVTPLYGSAAISVSTNATATWTVATQTNVQAVVLNLSGTVSSNGVCVFSAAVSNTTMAAGSYDSFVRIQDGATLVTASRTTLNVYKSPYPESPSVVPYSWAEPLWLAAASQTNTWNLATNSVADDRAWTNKLDASATNGYIRLADVPADNLAWQSNAVDSAARATNTAQDVAITGKVDAASLGSAAYSNASAFATSAQGALADTALQSESDTLQSVLTRGPIATTPFATNGATLAMAGFGTSVTGKRAGIMLFNAGSTPSIKGTNYFGVHSSSGFSRTDIGGTGYKMFDEGNFTAGNDYLATNAIDIHNTNTSAHLNLASLTYVTNQIATTAYPLTGNPSNFLTSATGLTNGDTRAVTLYNTVTVNSSLTATGGLNVGTSALAVPLSVGASKSANFVAYLYNLANDGYGLRLRNGNDANASFQILNSGGTVGNVTMYGDGKATFNGNVGIGTNAPAERLHVNGNVMVQSNLWVTGTVNGVHMATVITNNQTSVYLNLDGPANGFEDQFAQTLTYLPTRQCVVTPTGSVFRYTAGNVTYSSGTVTSPALGLVSGNQFFYFRASDGAFVATNTAWGITTGDAQVLYVLYNGEVTNYTYTIDERHGVRWPDSVHDYMHKTRGAAWASGITLAHNASDTATAAGANGTQTVVAVTDSGVFYDEDVIHATIANGTSANATNTAGQFPIFWKTNGVWHKETPTPFPFLWTGNVPQYVPSTGVRTSVTEDQYFVYWLVAAGGIDGTNLYLVPHPFTYASTTLADTGATIKNLSDTLGGFPSAEILVCYRMIFQFNATAPNANPVSVKSAKLRKVDDYRGIAAGLILAGTGSSGGISADSLVAVGGITNVSINGATGTVSGGIANLGTGFLTNGYASSIGISNHFVVSGNIGVGSTNITANLHVFKYGGAASLWLDNDGAYNSSMQFRNNNGSFKGLCGYVASPNTIGLTMDGSASDGLFVNSSHMVGIGTNNPTQKLHVVGTATITSNLTVGGSITLGSYDPYEASTDLLPLVVNGTCTLSRAMGRSLKIDQTGTVYFTMDTAIPTNGDYCATLNIRTNGATWGFVPGVITNTATILNGWTSIILHRGFNGTIVKGVSGQ